MKAPVPEYPGVLAAAGHGENQGAGLIPQPDGARTGLAVPQMEAEAFEVRPLQGQNFTDPASGQN